MNKCNNCVRRLNNLCKVDSENYEQCVAVNYRYFKQMTNFDRYKNISVEEMARKNLQYDVEKDRYITSDGSIFSVLYENELQNYNRFVGDRTVIKQKALQHEIEWLNSESEE